MFEHESLEWKEHQSQRFFDRFFPVTIKEQNDVLKIVDGRPSSEIFLFGIYALSSFVFTALLFDLAISTGFYWILLIFILPTPFFIYKISMLPFSRSYVFDKTEDVFRRRRRSLLKNESEEGSLSEIRGVQIETVMVSDGEGRSQRKYRVLLAFKAELLFGRAANAPLDEDLPLNSSHEIASRMAFAISDFLKVPVLDDSEI